MLGNFKPRPLRSIVQQSHFSYQHVTYLGYSQARRHTLSPYRNPRIQDSTISFEDRSHISPAVRPTITTYPLDCRLLVGGVQQKSQQLQPPSLNKVFHMESLSLTEEEQQIFRLMLEARNKSGSQTILRAAGGWVRDKLLGLNSDDIDLALDDTVGRDFAEKVREYLVQEGEAVSEVGVIQMNPEQSKHLETARLKVRGVWLDLVNLRAEAYAEDSRIPTSTAFGTPKQDAYRRDLTINSMFYNLNTGGIEDWTGMGMSDLRDKIIRTPLPPEDTFLDDPLRVLRAVRFSARFNFTLHPELIHAASLEHVKVALRDKVSKERVGGELDGMLKSKAPVDAMRNLLRMGIFDIVFPVPQASNLPHGRQYSEPCVAAMKAADELMKELGEQYFRKDEQRLALLASLLLPLQDCELTVKKKKVMVPAQIIKEEFKFRSKDADLVVTLHQTAKDLVHIAAELGLEGVHPRPQNSDAPRAGNGETGHGGYPAHLCVATGMVIRKLKEQWRLVLPVVAIQDVPCVMNLLDEACPVNFDLTPSDNSSEASRRVALCHQLEQMVEAMGLDRAWEIKPLIDGKTMMQLMGLDKGGPKLGEYMDKQLEWQLQYPTGTLEACKAFMLKHLQAVA